MNIGIVLLATNAYHVLGIRFIKKFLYHHKGQDNITFYLFTDDNPYDYLSAKEKEKVIPIYEKHYRWLDATNSRYKNILSLEKTKQDYIFYVDADTNVSQDFTMSPLIGDTVVLEHFFYTIDSNDDLPYDNNPKSSCYINPNSNLTRNYYHGSFFGGTKDNIMKFCSVSLKAQKENAKINHEPPWNDESHLNFYFHYNPPSKIVLCKNFLFHISTKANLGDTRSVRLNCEKLKQKMKHYKDYLYEIQGSELLPYPKN